MYLVSKPRRWQFKRTPGCSGQCSPFDSAQGERGRDGDEVCEWPAGPTVARALPSAVRPERSRRMTARCLSTLPQNCISDCGATIGDSTPSRPVSAIQAPVSGPMYSDSGLSQPAAQPCFRKTAPRSRAARQSHAGLIRRPSRCPPAPPGRLRRRPRECFSRQPEIMRDRARAIVEPPR